MVGLSRAVRMSNWCMDMKTLNEHAYLYDQRTFHRLEVENHVQSIRL